MRTLPLRPLSAAASSLLPPRRRLAAQLSLFRQAAPSRKAHHTAEMEVITNTVGGMEPRKVQRVDSPAPLMRVKKLSENATIPARGSAGAAGYDLTSAGDYVVPARGKELIKTDIAIAIPEDTYARIAPRSGLAWKHSIDVGAGVVDYDYRGNVGVILFNLSDKDFTVSKGDRVAQLILERIMTPEVLEVEDLDATTRGAGGFGSTGVSS